MPSSEPNRGDLLPGGGEMARRMRGLDWSVTDLGPPEAWPDNRGAALSLSLTSRLPTLIWWGPSLSVPYNDAYIPFLGPAKHPRVLGRPGRECWAEMWNAIGLMLDRVLAAGTRRENHLFYFLAAIHVIDQRLRAAPPAQERPAHPQGLHHPSFGSAPRGVPDRRTRAPVRAIN